MGIDFRIGIVDLRFTGISRGDVYSYYCKKRHRKFWQEPGDINLDENEVNREFFIKMLKEIRDARCRVKTPGKDFQKIGR